MKKIIRNENGNIKVVTLNDDPESRAQQQFKDQCDVNNIMKKYRLSGEITHRNIKQGRYGDFSEMVDYQAALDIVANAQGAFQELPSHVRSRFNNNPAEMLSFLENPQNDEEAIKLGLKELKQNEQKNQNLNTKTQNPKPKPKNQNEQNQQTE